MELKTLKELPHFSTGGGGLRRYFIPEIELKTEAIKWIKELQENDDSEKYLYRHGYCLKHRRVDKCYPRLGLSWEECGDIPAVVEFLTHFFNLTEEDLKNG